jgi:hypothetical protein
MSKQNKLATIPDEVIITKILLIRGKKVILDTDLADLYGVPTKRLNEQVKRNIKRFHSHFMFPLTKEEKEYVVANCDHLEKLKYSPFLPNAFTEHGIVMLANVLNSERAIQASIRIVEIFIKMHEMVLTHKNLLMKLNELEQKVSDHDDKILLVFEYLKQLEQAKQEELDFKKRKKIGYKRHNGDK